MAKTLDIRLPRLPDSVLEEAPPVVRDYVAEVEKTFAALVAQLEELGARVDESSRAAKRQATPFRTDNKRRKKKRKKPGRKGGHNQNRRSAPEHVNETDE